MEGLSWNEDLELRRCPIGTTTREKCGKNMFVAWFQRFLRRSVTKRQSAFDRKCSLGIRPLGKCAQEQSSRSTTSHTFARLNHFLYLIDGWTKGLDGHFHPRHDLFLHMLPDFSHKARRVSFQNAKSPSFPFFHMSCFCVRCKFQ